MGDLETFTEANLLWDPVAMRWARPQNQGLSHLSLREDSGYNEEKNIDQELLQTLKAHGVNLSGMTENSNYSDALEFYDDRANVDQCVREYLRSASQEAGTLNGYYRNQFSDSHPSNRYVQPSFQYIVPGKRKVKRHLDTIGMVYYVILAITILGVSQFLILPIVYEDSPVTLRYRTWFCWYVFYHILINYVLVYIYAAPYEQSSRYFADPGLPQSDWKRCDECEQLKPPRTHHCPFCDKCVLKRDHHCFFSGSCIGFHNQRHFIVMCFYCAVGAIYAFYLLWQYFCLEYYYPLSADFWHFVLPATIVEWLVGRSTLLFVFLVLLFYLVLTTGGGASFMFLWQMYLVYSGVTTHEFTKGIKTYRGAPLREKVHSVFGPWCLIQFIFPMPWISIKGDGMHWTHVAKKI